MYTLKVENKKGEILSFDDWHKYDILSIDGLAPADASINFSRLANFDGSVYNSARIGNRNIVLTIKIHNPAEENRINLYKYFQNKNQVRLHYENNTRKVFIDGYVEKFECGYFEMNQTVQISIICNNPYWKEETKAELEFSRVISCFEFPMDIPPEGIEFSRIETLLSAYILNSEIETGAIIEFRAVANGVVNPKFINRTTQKYFAIDFEMQSGDVIRVNTIKGEKSVTLIRNGTKTNIINKMAIGSEWVTLVAGINELSYECKSGAENLNVFISAYRCYEGV